MILRQLQACCQVGSDCLSVCSDGNGGNKAARLQFEIYEADDRLRDGKSQSLTSAPGRIDKCVDANQIAIAVYQWSATVAWIDRRIGLDVNHWAIQFGLPADCAHDSFGDGVIQSLGTSNRDDRLS